MKKLLFICSMIAMSLTSSAQFMAYRSVDTSQPSYTPSSGYGVPFTIYESLASSSYQSPYGDYPSQRIQQPTKPRMQEVTLKGYYKKGNYWYYSPIRVGVIGDEVRLLNAKTQYGWSNCGSKASDVGVWDSEEIRDNFNYKAYTTLYVTVYF